jgi:pseudouridine kinase
VPLLDVVVIGGTNVDCKSRPAGALVLGTSNPGRTTCTPGGVGRNVAEALALMGASVALVSVVGDDAFGAFVLDRTSAAGVDLDAVRVLPGAATGTYTVVLDERGELCVAVASMEATSALDLHDVERAALSVRPGGRLVIDANLEPALVAHALVVADACGIETALDPVSVPKAARVAAALTGAPLGLLTPNLAELRALAPFAEGDLATACRSLHDRGVQVVWVRDGARGSWVVEPGHEPVHVPSPPLTDVADVTGAGDAALAGYLWAALDGRPPVEAAHIGTAAARCTLRASGSVAGDLATAVRSASSRAVEAHATAGPATAGPTATDRPSPEEQP